MTRPRSTRVPAARSAVPPRLAALRAATEALSAAVSRSDVVRVALARGLAALGARAGALAQPAEGVRARLPARAGGRAAWDAAAAAADGPEAEAARTGRAIWIESSRDLGARFPHLRQIGRRARVGALVVLPLLARGRSLGVMSFLFAAPRRFGGADRALALALADACALALERALLVESERRLREEAEERAALGEDSAPFRNLVDQVRDYAIFMLDTRGFVLTWNLGAERIKGYRAEEVVGRHFSCFYTEADVRAGKPERALAAAAATGRFEDQGVRVRKDGTVFDADVVVTALRNPGGELRGFAKVTRDVTERLRAERERARLAQAEEVMRAREQLVAIAAHEFRTPITTLGLYTQALLRELDRGADSPLSAARPWLRTIHRQSVRLAHLVQALLDVMEITAGRLALRPEPVDLAAVVREAMDRWRETLSRAGCPLDLRVDRTVPGEWDRARIEQVIDYLVANALKFGAGRPVEVVLEARGAAAHLAVRDHGIGMSEEDRRKIFRRFERVAPLAHYGGFGLGLWLARNIVQAHGGEIQVSSTPGKGSRFEVTLPRLSA